MSVGVGKDILVREERAKWTLEEKGGREEGLK